MAVVVPPKPYGFGSPGMTMRDMLKHPPVGHGDRNLLVDVDDSTVVQVIGFVCVAHSLDSDCNQHGAWVDTQSMFHAAVHLMANPGCDVRLLGQPHPGPNETYPKEN